MPLLYAAVLRDGALLAQHALVAGNFSAVVQQCLPHLQPDQARLTLMVDGHTFNFARRDGFVFVVAAEEAFGRVIPFAFLDRVGSDWTATCALRCAKGAAPGSFQRPFEPKLKQHLEFCSANPDELSAVAACQRKVDDVRTVMVQNIDRVLARGEKIELLVDKCESLSTEAAAFQRHGRQLHSRMWWQNMRVKAFVVLAVLLLAVVIFLLACFAGGQNCTKKH